MCRLTAGAAGRDPPPPGQQAGMQICIYASSGLWACDCERTWARRSCHHLCSLLGLLPIGHEPYDPPATCLVPRRAVMPCCVSHQRADYAHALHHARWLAVPACRPQMAAARALSRARMQPIARRPKRARRPPARPARRRAARRRPQLRQASRCSTWRLRPLSPWRAEQRRACCVCYYFIISHVCVHA